jgi:hypothetical protein
MELGVRIGTTLICKGCCFEGWGLATGERMGVFMWTGMEGPKDTTICFFRCCMEFWAPNGAV